MVLSLCVLKSWDLYSSQIIIKYNFHLIYHIWISQQCCHLAVRRFGAALKIRHIKSFKMTLVEQKSEYSFMRYGFQFEFYEISHISKNCGWILVQHISYCSSRRAESVALQTRWVKTLHFVKFRWHLTIYFSAVNWKWQLSQILTDFFTTRVILKLLSSRFCSATFDSSSGKVSR